MSRDHLPGTSAWVSTFVEVHSKPSYTHNKENKSITLNYDDDSPYNKVFFLDATRESLQKIINVLQQAQMELEE
jgi:hypothetical protein